MRNLVLGGGATRRRRTTVTPAVETARTNDKAGTATITEQQQGLPSNVFVVDNLKDYKSVVGDETEKVVAVRFYATWCRACKAVAPLYYRMAARHPDTIFVDVPVSDKNAPLHQGLGVPSLPFGHIYHPESGLVEELKLTRKHVPCFERRLDSYRTGSCVLDEEETYFVSDDATASADA